MSSTAPLPERSLVHLTYVCPHCGAISKRMLKRGQIARLPCVSCGQLADLFTEVSAAFGPPRSEQWSKVIQSFRHALDHDDD